MSRQWIRRGLSLGAACFAVALGWNTCANSHQSQIPPIGNSDTPRPSAEESKKLGGEDRYQTFVSTDKPIYKEGEKVYVRGVLLDCENHRPLPGGHCNASIQIKGPKGDVVAGGTANGQDSVWAFAWDVPAGQAGGEYKIKVTYPWEGHAPAERKFDIRAYRPPRLKSQITFLRDGYGPGEKVNATLDVKRAEGGIPEGAKVSVVATIDGMEVNGGTAQVDANGLCSVSFNLPQDIPRGEGTLALIIEDGGVVETASKTIPILLQTVDLEMFPEGGDLIAGYKNRVYVQAKQPNGKPADLTGTVKIEEAAGPGEVAQFHTEHEGRGRFEFTPEANKDYYLSISAPAGIKTKYKLPAIKVLGAVIQADKEVYEKNSPVTVHVGTTEQSFRVTVCKREVELAAYKADQSKRDDIPPFTLHPISFPLAPEIDGVLTVTVWNDKGEPLAERLVYRQPANPLNISITKDKKTYVPGDTTNLTVKATDADGKPVSAVVGLTVTDDSVLEMVEKREQAPRLPVMVFLEPEVKDLADAHVYLDPKNPKAAIATDLILATQGWRRFALMDLAKFIETNGDAARRATALKIQSRMEMEKLAHMAVPPGAALNMMAFGNAMAMPKAAAPMEGAMMKPRAGHGAPVQFFQARRQMDVVDDRPIVRDFREAPALEKQMKGKAGFQVQEGVAFKNAEKDAGIMGMGMGRGFIAQNRQGIAGNEKLQAAIGQADKKERMMQIAGDEIASELSSLVYVREFAHKVRENRKLTDRVDFTETVYWNAGVKTDAKTGEAKISFDLSDSVSTFRVFADGFSDSSTGSGAVGAGDLAVESVQPFYVEAKMPLEVTYGDQILLPISMVNASGESLANTAVNVDLKGDFQLASLLNARGDMAAGERLRCLQPINVGAVNGSKNLVISSKAGVFADRVERKLSVKPKGFPIEVPFGGMLEPNKTVIHTITIPSGVVQGSLACNTAVYPTPLANLTEALERLIQDPCGCFEQTSSTSYPLTMAQQYFLSHTGINPKLVEDSKKKLDTGYKMLVGFWCPDKGYEWFGQDPGHEALTAYGIMHFADMSQVREVDQNMINTTREWLMKQRDGQGGFSRKRRALHTWIEDKDCSNAYILWALLETGQPAADLKPELDSIKKAAASSHNSYVLALAANALFIAGDKSEATQLMDRLASKQKEDGSVGEIASSIVGSGGEALQIEGTSLATLAWMRDPKYAGNVEKSIKFLADSCKAGRYGSTQSTVLALRAIVTYDKLRAHPKAPGKVRVFVDGQPVGDWKAFDASTEGAIKLPDLSAVLKPGEHKLELRMEGGGPMPYSLAVKYNAMTPASSKECKLDLNVKMLQDKVAEGVATQANVTVINTSKDVIPTPVAIIGLPGGLEPRHDQLKELVKKHTIDAYEVKGRDVVLYWRTLPGEAKVEVPLSVIAAIPGTYTGPASRSYLYYTDEHKKWVDGLRVQITPK